MKQTTMAKKKKPTSVIGYGVTFSQHQNSFLKGCEIIVPLLKVRCLSILHSSHHMRSPYISSYATSTPHLSFRTGEQREQVPGAAQAEAGYSFNIILYHYQQKALLQCQALRMKSVPAYCPLDSFLPNSSA